MTEVDLSKVTKDAADAFIRDAKMKKEGENAFVLASLNEGDVTPLIFFGNIPNLMKLLANMLEYFSDVVEKKHESCVICAYKDVLIPMWRNMARKTSIAASVEDYGAELQKIQNSDDPVGEMLRMLKNEMDAMDQKSGDGDEKSD